MKLASLKSGGRDGTLIVVSRDLERFVRAGDVAPTLQAALDDWARARPRLQAIYAELQDGKLTLSLAEDEAVKITVSQ